MHAMRFVNGLKVETITPDNGRDLLKHFETCRATKFGTAWLSAMSQNGLRKTMSKIVLGVLRRLTRSVLSRAAHRTRGKRPRGAGRSAGYALPWWVRGIVPRGAEE